MTLQKALQEIKTEHYMITKKGKILCVNGKVGGKYSLNENVKKIDVIHNVCDHLPVITCIRI